MSKEIPVLFNGEMVRAILDGRKVQTRRPYKGNDFLPANKVTAIKPHSGGGFIATDGDPDGIEEFFDCGFESPFGKAGDVLWVRETFTKDYRPSDTPFLYKADGVKLDRAYGEKWTPSIHMPRKACRIKLKVKRVWVERVQDITWEGARAEGIIPAGIGSDHADIEAFKALWNSIYGTWNDSPWVWCCEFEVTNNGKKEATK